MRSQARCVAHEIRNQISICELYSQVIKKHLEKSNYKNPSVENALCCITKSLKIMSSNLIDLKALDNLDLKKINAESILKEAINLSVIYIQDKDIKILLNCPAKTSMVADENKFLACVVNIIKNAIESIDEKGEITISVFKNENNLSIKFSNNGKSIPKEIQSEIFTQGFTTKETGSGLGLCICFENIKAQNGELKLVKSDSTSTDFEIIIPCC